MNATTKSLLVLLFLCSPVLAAPSVVSSEPGNGAVGVPVETRVLRVTFSEDMQLGSLSLFGSDRGELIPLLDPGADPWKAPRVCEFALGPLAPGRTYAVRLNNAEKGRQGFRSAAGEPLPDTVIAFRTADAPAPPPAPPPSPRAPVAVPALDLGPVKEDPTREWTVVVYMAGDNDIEKYGPETLNDIEAKFPDRGVEVIVLFDRAKEFDATHEDWNDTRVYRVRRGARTDAFESVLLAQPGEWNLGDPSALAAILAAALRTFPAKQSLLMFWDHGMGWGGNAVDHDAPGHPAGRDELTLPETRAGIEAGLAAAGRPRLDIVLFHMCLMGQVEVATEMAGLADFMIASEAMIPCAYVPYGDLVAALPGSADSRAAAERLANTYSTMYRTKNDPVSTSSAVDLNGLPRLLDALDALATKLAPSVATAWPVLARSLFFGQNYMGRTDYRNGPGAIMSLDLLDVLARIRANLPGFPAEAEYARVVAEHSRCVFGVYHGPRWRLSHGLAIYGPPRGDLLRPEYRETAFAKRGPWLALLERMHAEMKRVQSPPAITGARITDAAGRETPVVEGLNGARIDFTVEGRNILWVVAQQVKRLREPAGLAVMFRTFVVDPRYEKRRAESASDLVDLLMPEYADGANPMAKEVGGIVFKVTDGTKLVEATVDYSDPSDLFHARVPAIYSHPAEGKCLATIVFDINWTNAVGLIGMIPTPDGRLVPKMIEPNPDAEITLLYEVMTPDDKSTLVPTATLKWGTGLALVPVFQEPGQYGLLVGAESIEGFGGSRLVAYEQRSTAEFEALVREGGRFTPQELIGEWKMTAGRASGAGGLEFVPAGMGLRFFVDPADPRKIRYEFRSDGGEVVLAGIVVHDNRGAPCLVYFREEPGAGWVRAEFHIAFHLPSATEDAFLLKDLFAGHVIRIVRPRTGPVVPGPVPPPAPAAGLDGTWRTADGQFAIVMRAGQYQAHMGGAMIDQGVYQVSGNVITSRNAMGLTENIRFTLAGNTLTLSYPNGTVVVLKGP